MGGHFAVSVSTPLPAAVPASSRPRGSRSLEQKAVSLSTGVTLRYVEQGDRAGVPVVLLHGVTDSWHSFEAVLRHLPQSVRAFALTQRGHGDSERPASGYRTRDFAADIAAFLDAIGVRSAVVVGHSMGTTNAQRFVIEHPERARGLLTVGTFASYRRNAVMKDFWDSAIATLADPVDPGFAREFQESTLARPVPAELLDTAVRESLKVPAPIWRAAFAGMLEDDCVDDLERIAVPTMLLWGERDAFIPRSDQDVLLSAIGGSRLIVYRGAGHAPHWEEPERFASDLTAFVAGCSDQSAGAGASK